MMKLPILGKMTRNKSIAVGIALAFLLMMVTGSLGGFDDMTETFEDGTAQSAISGTFDAYAELQTPTGAVVWSTDGGSDVLGPQSILDPETGQVVSQLVMGVKWVATGTDLDWDTMKVWGRFWFWSYQGNGGGKDYTLTLEDIDVLYTSMSSEMKEDGLEISGGMEYDPAILADHMPDTVVMIFWDWSEELQRKISYTEEYPQTTSEPHPMTFVYKAQYWVEVTDLYGNPFFGEYTQYSTLNLQWSGTDFDIEWGGEEESTGTETSVTPTINNLADYSTPYGSPFSLVWTPRDGDHNPSTYSITVDGVAKTSGAWDGGDITYTTKYATGMHIVECTVTDMDGNTVSDSAEIFSYEELNEGELPSVDPTDETDASADFYTGSVDYESDAYAAMSILGDAVGSQQEVVLLVAVAGMIVVGIKTDAPKKIGKQLKKFMS